MKKISLLFLAICSFCFTSCLSDLDNYEAPNGGISGRILDAETNEPIPLPVQGSTGVIINMFEQNTGATQSVDFYAKMDGTYENSKLFNCEYKIVVNGPFVSPCEDFVTVNGQTTFDVTAIPSLRTNQCQRTSIRENGNGHLQSNTDRPFLYCVRCLRILEFCTGCR